MKPWIIYDGRTKLFYRGQIGSFRFVDDLHDATPFGDYDLFVDTINFLKWLGVPAKAGTLPVSFWYSREVN
jgi:hypothetical protein